jgi:hypothetical protein
LPPGPSYALVARDAAFDVIVDPVDAGSFGVLRALAEGHTLGQGAELADPTQALAVLLRHSLIIGVIT